MISVERFDGRFVMITIGIGSPEPRAEAVGPEEARKLAQNILSCVDQIEHGKRVCQGCSAKLDFAIATPGGLDSHLCEKCWRNKYMPVSAP